MDNYDYSCSYTQLNCNICQFCRASTNTFFTLCTVLTPFSLSFATFRMEYPLRSKLITSLYSAFICSAVFTEPTLRPSFPPFSIYRFLPDCNRNEILSRSNCAQVESVAIIIGAKRDGLILLGNVVHLVGMEEKVILVVVYNLALLLPF